MTCRSQRRTSLRSVQHQSLSRQLRKLTDTGYLTTDRAARSLMYALPHSQHSRERLEQHRASQTIGPRTSEASHAMS